MYHVFELACPLPFFAIGESLRIDVSSHGGGVLVEKVEASFGKGVMKVGNADAVCSAHVSHGWVPSVLANLGHSLIVFVELQGVGFVKQNVPKRNGRHAGDAQAMVRSNDFSFRCGMTDARLLLGNPA